LGADIKEWSLSSLNEPGKKCWAISSETYVKRVIKDVEMELETMGRRQEVGDQGNDRAQVIDRS